MYVLGFEKIPLVWEDDMQMHSQFLDRKVNLPFNFLPFFLFLRLTVPDQSCLLLCISTYSVKLEY